MTIPSKVDLKNPWTAGILAYLIPGAGHLYQGRVFKAALYFVCILGTFFWGLSLGEWQVVYHRWEPGNRNLGYLSQVLVGLPALPALIQSKRYQALPTDPGRPQRQSDKQATLEEDRLDTTFTGRIRHTGVDGETVVETVSGHLVLEHVQDEFGRQVQGTLQGTLGDGTPVEYRVSEPLVIGPRIYASEEITPTFTVDDEIAPREFASHRRYLQCRIVGLDGDISAAGYLEGTIPRAFWDWFQVPLEEDALQHLHGRLGKLFELATVFTWIAGLLNLLAIWDAIEGPAYGYGDEQEAVSEAEGVAGETTTSTDSQVDAKAASSADAKHQPEPMTS